MIGGLSLLAGVLLGLALPREPPGAWYAGVGLGLLLLALPLLREAATRRLALLLAGFLLSAIDVQRWQQLRLGSESADARLLVEGRVLGVPSYEGAELRFDAEVRVLQGTGAGQGLRRARLAWRDAPRELQAGERWRWLLRLAPAESLRNFDGHDAARIFMRDGVHFSARVLPAALNERLAAAPASIDTARARIAGRIAARVADPDAAALLAALAVGLDDGVSADQWRVFNATGTTHLVAISGLHVTLFATLAFFVARLAWRWLPGARRVEREPFALIAGLAAAGGYALLAGFSVPTQRTWLMLAVFVVARLSSRHVGPGRVWGLALAGVLLFDACAPLSAGFWLSFIAVGVILVVESGALWRSGRAWRFLRLQLAVLVALAPFTLLQFGGVSVAGVWVNLIAIPVVSFVLVPLVLAGVIVDWMFVPAAWCYELFWPVLTWAADTPLAQWRVDPPAWWYLLAIPAGWIWLQRWPWALRLASAVLLLPLLYPASRMPSEGTARVTVLDAGRGTAVLVATHSQVLLFDTGDSWSTAGSRVRRVVLPALDALGRDRVDLVVLPALNPDRARGAALLAQERGLEQLVVGGGWPASRLPAARCVDDVQRRDGVVIETIAAGRGGEFCALKLSVEAHALWLAGDLDARAEAGLVARLGAARTRADAVLLSRQASARGSSSQWIEATGASLAIASGGDADNESRRRVLDRWRHAGATLLDTRRDGAVELELGTQGVRVTRTAQGARYPFPWRRPP